jgi:hypothetical protein
VDGRVVSSDVVRVRTTLLDTTRVARRDLIPALKG